MENEMITRGRNVPEDVCLKLVAKLGTSTSSPGKLCNLQGLTTVLMAFIPCCHFPCTLMNVQYFPSLHPSFCESRHLHITSASIILRRKYQYTPSEAVLFFCYLECYNWCLVHRNLPGPELNMTCHGGKGTFSFGKMWNFCFQPSI